MTKNSRQRYKYLEKAYKILPERFLFLSVSLFKVDLTGLWKKNLKSVYRNLVCVYGESCIFLRNLKAVFGQIEAQFLFMFTYFLT